jgi:DNA-binding XRE family transcriptional regulator
MKENWLWDKKITDPEARRVLKDPGGGNFTDMAALLLARSNDPQTVFKGYIDPLVFCRHWSSIKRKMRRDKWAEPRIVFWQAIYEKLAEKYRKQGVVFRKETAAKQPLCVETGKKIAHARRKSGLSQKELAGKMGVSQQLVSRIESGRENISLGTLSNVSRALGKRVRIDLGDE